MRHLVRVYYNAVVSGHKTAEFKYVDEELDDIGIELHQLGLTLQLTPGRLRALFKEAPDMDNFLLEEPIDLGEARTQAYLRDRAVHADPESTDDDRVEAEEVSSHAGDDLAAYQMMFFVADVLVGWLMIPPGALSALERRRRKRAMDVLVSYATEPMYRENDAFGDALTTCCRPIYGSEFLAAEFARAGGISAMYLDWVCIDLVCVGHLLIVIGIRI